MAQLWQVHATIMSIGLVILLVSAILQRVFGTRPWRLKNHKIVGGITALVIVVGFIIAFYMVSLSSLSHFNYIHSWLGLTSIALAVATAVIGYFRLRWGTNRSGFRRVHIGISILAALLISVTIIFGLMLVY